MQACLTAQLSLFLAFSAGAAAFATNTPDADAFVRALAPEANYGAAGALSISGASPQSDSPTNGAFDTFMRFNTGAMVSNFDAAFGAHNWVITSATLNLTENANPGNSIFNYGTGEFEIRWMADDNWTEGTGNPKAPTSDGITYSNEATLLNSATDVSLGPFTFAGSPTLSCALPLPAAFVNNMQAGGEVGLFMTAIDPGLGFVFYSRNFAGNPNALPALVVSATAQPVITAIQVCGADLILSATNGLTGGSYRVLTSTNLSVPASQWTPLLTNVPAGGGGFSITVTNAAGAGAPSPQFFMIQSW